MRSLLCRAVLLFICFPSASFLIAQEAVHVPSGYAATTWFRTDSSETRMFLKTIGREDYWVSEDGGANWTLVMGRLGDDLQYVRGIEPLDAGADTLVLRGLFNIIDPRRPTFKGIAVSTDGGNTWSFILGDFVQSNSENYMVIDRTDHIVVLINKLAFAISLNSADVSPPCRRLFENAINTSLVIPAQAGIQ